MLGPLLRQLMALGIARKTAPSAVTLFNDSFSTDGAVSAGARTADPGPGSATIADSTGVWSSISGGILTPSKGFTVNYQPDYQSEAMDYNPGRALITRLTPDGLGGSQVENWIHAGWSDGAANIDNSVYAQFRLETFAGSVTAGIIVNEEGLRNPLGIASYPAAGEYVQIAVVMQPTAMLESYWVDFEGYQAGNFYIFIDKKLRYFSLWGIPGTWSLSNMIARLTHSYSGIAPRSAAEVDYFRVRDLGVPFSDGSFATVDERPPSWDTPYTADADGIFQFVFSSVAVPTGTAEMRFRIQDADNYWTMYFSVAENCYCVDSVAAGVPTRRLTGPDATGSGMWYPDGYQNGYRILAEGTTLTVYSVSYGYVYIEGQITFDHCTTATGVRVVQDNTDYTPQSLVCFPLSSPAYDAFDEV